MKRRQHGSIENPVTTHESNEQFAVNFDRKLYDLATTARQLGLTAPPGRVRTRWLKVFAELAQARTHVVTMLPESVPPS